MHGRDGLFRSGNEVLVVTVSGDLEIRAGNIRVEETYTVKCLVKFGKLGSLSHHLFPHHERSLDLLVSLLSQERQSVVDQRKIKVDTITSQEVTTVTCNLYSYYQLGYQIKSLGS